ncbi:MAG: type II toxin-antitoxin system prevent-host-death family antitoxin [Nitrospirota bacterium]
MTPKTVGIRDLKTRLSKHLKDVKKGQEIVVSERGKVVAKIIPVTSLLEQSKLQSFLFKLSSEGKIMLPLSYSPPALPKFRKKVKGTPFSDAVIEGRR